MPLRYWPCEKNCSVAASPRSWSSALCRYARYWISGTGTKPLTRRAEREPEDRRLVEQRVEDAAGAEALLQAARDAVDAALDRDVLAEDEHVRDRARARRRARALIAERERQRLAVGTRPAGAQRRAGAERRRERRATISAAESSCGMRGGLVGERAHPRAACSR